MSAEALARAIEQGQPCVALTGAGMSTESGIPDFRSAAGMWAEVDPFEVASIDAFRRDPLRVWRWYGPRIRRLCDAEPNPGHRALARLERAGLLRAVVTQNIDTLHTRADTADVVEVHGSGPRRPWEPAAPSPSSTWTRRPTTTSPSWSSETPASCWRRRHGCCSTAADDWAQEAPGGMTGA